MDGSLTALVDLLADLPAAHGDGGWLLVPDTNALLFKPDLETWRPPGGAWTVVLVPQVLRELDAVKMRRGDVADKAAGVIRRVKEYARRGDTFKGVPIADSLSLREVAVDADMGDTLPWLRAGHGDDELLAGVLELRCQDLSAVVALASRDRNLQNNARLARCLYLDSRPEGQRRGVRRLPDPVEVPTISRFYGIVIRMYFVDHAPPHFHAFYAGEEAVIAIQTDEILRGALPGRALRLVREWTAMHRDELTANWERLQVPEQPAPITPLP